MTPDPAPRTSDPTRPALPPVIQRASRDELPEWAVASAERRAHIRRVADLMEEWARAGGRSSVDVARWRAAGVLHDALRDADPASLRPLLPAEDRDLPDPILHGPAAAARLREEGVEDAELLRAVAYHTLGHPEMEALGRAVYCADFLEPEREFLEEWRAELRARMPDEIDAVVREVVRARLVHLLRENRAIRPETLRFWNVLAPGEPVPSSAPAPTGAPVPTDRPGPPVPTDRPGPPRPPAPPEEEEWETDSAG